METNRKEIVAVSAVRTPFGKFGGLMKDIDIYDLGSIVMRESISQIGIDPELIDEVWWGCGDTTNCKDPFTPIVARQSMLKAGIPATKTSITFDKACVSGMSAAYYAMGRISIGEVRIVLTGGATSFSTVPFLARDLRWNGNRIGGFSLEDPLLPLGYKDYAPVASDGGEVAVCYGVNREEQDEFALSSHLKYGKAHNKGFFKNEMKPIGIKIKVGRNEELKMLEIDEQYRSNITYEDLKKLKPIFGNPTITAGNAPGLNDGAAAQILMDSLTAEQMGFELLYSILDMTSIAVQPNLLSVAPALAIKKCLNRSNITLDEIDIIEVNEAFASVPLVTCKLLSCKGFMEEEYSDTIRKINSYPLDKFDENKYQELKSKLNVNGGAVSVGHANTASGARLMMTAANELKRRGGGKAVCAICGGLAQGDACVIRV
ncbi:MAG: acetyl-CoA C-acyltransferase [Firmicutes bacterium HGW-Firmicutes-12]|nr:MAG: acetyl-CoA C-acyltransferase [Firmicutes bacterium HGW-Firmicutes-12]